MQKSVFVLFKLRNLYTDLPVILDKDYKTISNMFYFNKIYFVSDGKKNWRKDFFKEYKEKRKKNDSINWETVYDIYNKFKYSLKKKKNCDVYQIDNLEGDDIISYIIKETNKKGQSNLIVANDSDLFQLVNYDEVNNYINFMYNFKFSDERVYLPNLYRSFIDNIESDSSFDDLFEGNDTDGEFLDFFNSLISNKKVSEVDYEKELFVKIIGHNKDNIKSIYMKGNRGIGKSGGEKIYDFYKETYPGVIDFDSSIFKDRLIESVKYYKKLKDDNMDDFMKKRLDRNLKLVKLDKLSIPSDLYEKMEDVIMVW